MENKIDSSFERSILFRVVAIIVCIIIAGSSFLDLQKLFIARVKNKQRNYKVSR